MKGFISSYRLRFVFTDNG